jgi:hypothetical protein
VPVVGVTGHRTQRPRGAKLDLKERELVAVEITVWASIALRQRSASATALGIRWSWHGEGVLDKSYVAS